MSLAMVATSAFAGCSSQTHRVPPTFTREDLKIAAAVQTTLRKLAARPSSGVAHGTRVVLAPICVSRVNRSYILVIATPFRSAQPAGIGQPGALYLHRRQGRYVVIDGKLLVEQQAAKRPPNLPKAVFYGFARRSSCVGLSPSMLLRVIREHRAPTVTS